MRCLFKKQCPVKKNKEIIFAVIGVLIAVSAVVLKLVCYINKFKKNSDRFFAMQKADINYDDKPFTDECMASLMSNVKIDLKNADASDNPMNLCLKTKFSTVLVEVPSDWNVKVQGNPVNSNIINEVSFDKENFDAPLLFINYFAQSSNIKIVSEIE